MENEVSIKKELVMEVVENQLTTASDEIPEVKENYDRLIADGYSDGEARELIASVLVQELYIVMKEDCKFNRERYSAALNQLPELPVEYYKEGNGETPEIKDDVILMPNIPSETLKTGT
ncbi:MAG: hypothetical protein GY940_26685 [bacterium]|nr:hypothetical protein [bacterium]